MLRNVRLDTYNDTRSILFVLSSTLAPQSRRKCANTPATLPSIPKVNEDNDVTHGQFGRQIVDFFSPARDGKLDSLVGVRLC